MQMQRKRVVGRKFFRRHGQWFYREPGGALHGPFDRVFEIRLEVPLGGSWQPGPRELRGAGMARLLLQAGEA